jgi:hypothetical protein
MAITGDPLWSDADSLYFDATNGREVVREGDEWFYASDLVAAGVNMKSVESWLEYILRIKGNEEPLDSYDWAQIQGYIQAIRDVLSVIEANK